MLPQPQMQSSRQSRQSRQSRLSRRIQVLWPVSHQAHKGAGNHPQFSKPLVLSPGPPSRRLLSHRVVTTHHVVNMQSQCAVKQAQSPLACRLIMYTLPNMTWGNVLQQVMLLSYMKAHRVSTIPMLKNPKNLRAKAKERTQSSKLLPPALITSSKMATTWTLICE